MAENKLNNFTQPPTQLPQQFNHNSNTTQSPSLINKNMLKRANKSSVKIICSVTLLHCVPSRIEFNCKYKNKKINVNITRDDVL